MLGRFINPASQQTHYSLLASILGLCLFILSPVIGGASALVTGRTRVLLSISCILFGYSFFRTARASVYLDKPLALLGQASYSLYLLHPIVYAVGKAIFAILYKVINVNIFINENILFAIQFSASLFVSYFSYYYFERYFIRLGHRSKQ